MFNLEINFVPFDSQNDNLARLANCKNIFSGDQFHQYRPRVSESGSVSSLSCNIMARASFRLTDESTISNFRWACETFLGLILFKFIDSTQKFQNTKICIHSQINNLMHKATK